MIISAAQVWYISKVYPERVTKQEAEDCIDGKICQKMIKVIG
jgi:hypothetical protein